MIYLATALGLFGAVLAALALSVSYMPDIDRAAALRERCEPFGGSRVLVIDERVGFEHYAVLCDGGEYFLE